MWVWRWWLFILAMIIYTIIGQFSGGAMNAVNISRYGVHADYRAALRIAILSSILAGVICAAVITAITSFIF